LRDLFDTIAAVEIAGIDDGFAAEFVSNPTVVLKVVR